MFKPTGGKPEPVFYHVFKRGVVVVVVGWARLTVMVCKKGFPPVGFIS